MSVSREDPILWKGTSNGTLHNHGLTMCRSLLLPGSKGDDMFTIPHFIAAKAKHQAIAMLTCYDYWSASILATTNIDAVLVGDSTAMVMHGYSSTLPATAAMIETHVRAVRNASPELCIIADMPFLSTRTGLNDAVTIAGSFMQAGANAVKIEGWRGHETMIAHLVDSGIPVMGHLGLQPQSVNTYGAYHVQGKKQDAAERIFSEARELEKAGCFSIVLECVPEDLAHKIATAIGIPVIGIGAGVGVDGQILVLQDMLGLMQSQSPRFVRHFLQGATLIQQAANRYVQAVKDRSFPSSSESYGHKDLAGPKPLVFKNPLEWRAHLALLKQGTPGTSIGFIPTMGALHAGHVSLVAHSCAENTYTVASIFVNPTQFDNPDDLAAYPATLETDLQALHSAGVHAVFLPDASTMYPDGYRYKIQEQQFSQTLCGAHRPGHFDGVLSVVMKLFMLTMPDRAYFGEKDYQQMTLIKGMVEAFFLPITIVPCPIVREGHGLAMSSRNVRLSTQGREYAAMLYKILLASVTVQPASTVHEVRNLLEGAGFSVDYVEDLPASPGQKARRLAAINYEGVRLIDNVEIQL